MGPGPERFCSVSEAARLLGMSEAGVRQLVARGEIAATDTGLGRRPRWLLPREQVEEHRRRKLRAFGVSDEQPHAGYDIEGLRAENHSLRQKANVLEAELERLRLMVEDFVAFNEAMSGRIKQGLDGALARLADEARGELTISQRND